MPSKPPVDIDAAPDLLPGTGRRAADRILEHWQRIRGEGTTLPSLADLALGEYPDIVERSFLLREDRDPRISVFILCGKSVSEAIGSDPLGLALEDVLAKRIEARLCEACDQAIREVRPVRSEGAYQAEDGNDVHYRAIFMPARSGRQFEDGYVFGTFGKKTALRKRVA
ncbi:MAG: PAS domain-containing protein [Alphaproteobacteria bacterium]|jgi:hypothetical protein|nr:PAS domain-containing protein [Alphaproteobacteria bacterium]